MSAILSVLGKIAKYALFILPALKTVVKVVKDVIQIFKDILSIFKEAKELWNKDIKTLWQEFKDVFKT